MNKTGDKLIFAIVGEGNRVNVDRINLNMVSFSKITIYHASAFNLLNTYFFTFLIIV